MRRDEGLQVHRVEDLNHFKVVGDGADYWFYWRWRWRGRGSGSECRGGCYRGRLDGGSLRNNERNRPQRDGSEEYRTKRR